MKKLENAQKQKKKFDMTPVSSSCTFHGETTFDGGNRAAGPGAVSLFVP